jgi:hypothetical protein
MFTRDKMIESASNSILMIASDSSGSSKHLRTVKISIFTKLNTSNFQDFTRINQVEIDLKDHITAPIDNIFRIQRSHPLRNRNCDIYLLISELLEVKYFTVEFGVIEFSP